MNLIATKKKSKGRTRQTVQAGFSRTELVVINKAIDKHLKEGSPLQIVLTSTYLKPENPGSCCFILEEEKI